MKRELTPAAAFPWTSAPGGTRTVRLFFDEPPSIGVDEFRDLVVGADHAHDEDTLEAIMASFAERHGHELVNFATGGHEDPLSQLGTIGFRLKT